MKATTALLLLAAGLLAGPRLAAAQTTILDYTGDLAGSGTLPAPQCNPGPPPGCPATLSGPSSATLTDSITITGSPTSNNFTIDDNLTVNGDVAGAGFSFSGSLDFAALCSNLQCNGPTGNIQFTETNGLVTGFSEYLNNFPLSYNASTFWACVNTSGTTGSASYVYFWGQDGGCGNVPAPICAAGGGGSVAATEVSDEAAPEIDPASAIGGLTPLVGGLAEMRGRKSIAQ